jgi:hypothetical protein
MPVAHTAVCTRGHFVVFYRVEKSSITYNLSVHGKTRKSIAGLNTADHVISVSRALAELIPVTLLAFFSGAFNDICLLRRWKWRGSKSS